MSRTSRRFLMTLPLAAFALAACQPGAQDVSVDDAWVRLPPVAGRPAAGYFTLHGGAKADRLVAVTSAKAGRVELHESGMAGGMMTMRAIDGADVPAGGEVKFAPGGNHAMLFDVAADVRPGGTIPLSFRFASGKTLEVAARAQAAGDAAPGHDGH